MSPLARLLDWLSFTYRVLFVVSAGNHLSTIDVGMSFSDFSALSIEDRNSIIIQNLNNNARIQRLLSPAESINALTVGASFSDESSFTADARQLLPCSDNMVSPISALGRGLNNSIKPDIIFDGGRNTVLQNNMGGTELRWRPSLTRAPGTVSAAPYDLSSGAQKINSALGFPPRATDYLYRFFGYGKPDIDKAIECAKNRITLIGYGELKDGEAHLFDLPLPFYEFSREKILRRLTATLACFSPITPSRQAYRSAQLWFSIEGTKKHLIDNRINADWQAVRRESLQHEIFENNEIIVWGADDAIRA